MRDIPPLSPSKTLTLEELGVKMYHDPTKSLWEVAWTKNHKASSKIYQSESWAIRKYRSILKIRRRD